MKRDALLLIAIAVVLAFLAHGLPLAMIYAKERKMDVSKIHGRIQYVTSFPDYKVQVVKSFPDLKVKVVQSFPKNAGEWQIVDSFPDYKIQLVEAFPDFTIQYVDSFPGPAK